MNLGLPRWARLGRGLLTLCLSACLLAGAWAQLRAATPAQSQRQAEFHRLLGEGDRSPAEVLRAINSIFSQSGGRCRVANFKDNGVDGGTPTLYASVPTGVAGREEVTWTMDFGTRPGPALRTTIAAMFRKSPLRPDHFVFDGGLQ